MRILKDGRDLNNSVFIVESHEVDSNGNFLKLYFESTNNSKRKLRLIDNNNKEYLINVGEYLDRDYNLYAELKFLCWIKGLYHILVTNIKNKKYNSKLELTDESVESIKEVDLVEHIKIITEYGYFDDILPPLEITTKEILDIVIENDYSFYGSMISKNKLFIMLNDYMERDTEVYDACDKDYFIADDGLEDSLSFLYVTSKTFKESIKVFFRKAFSLLLLSKTVKESIKVFFRNAFSLPMIIIYVTVFLLTTIVIKLFLR